MDALALRTVARLRASTTTRVLAAAVIASFLARFWTVPESRGWLLLIAATLCWMADVVPDYVVALGVVVVWEVAGVGPSDRGPCGSRRRCAGARRSSPTTWSPSAWSSSGTWPGSIRAHRASPDSPPRSGS